MAKTSVAKRCPVCGGDKKPGMATYTAESENGVVVIRNVPASVCGQCGEEWISDAVAAKVERIVESANSRHAQVEVLSL